MIYYKSDSGDFVQWATGRASCIVRGIDDGINVPLIGVRCRLGYRHDVIALLDTGAEWSVICEDTAKALGPDIEDLELPPILMNTRRGRKPGRMHRLTIELLADRGCGEDLCIDATVLVLSEWDPPDVLGFRGLLERVQFALEPQIVDPVFHFGQANP